MSTIELQLPDDLVERIRNHAERLPEILELGLREISSEAQPGFAGAAEVLEFLANLPTPEEILNLKPSERLEQQVRMLLEKNRAGTLTFQEERAWEHYEFVEHLVRMAKSKAHSRLAGKA